MLPSSHASWSLEDWLQYQQRLHPQGIALGLERVQAVAARLGLLADPPRTIIIGGTNGKGSTTTLLAAIYREAGYSVGAYTSPHLLRYNERITINGQLATDEALCTAFSAIEQARAELSLTYFEFGTLAALWLFSRPKLDVQVLEVGLGGRLDAVNIFDTDAALVTNIGLDHQDWLGSGRNAIGVEKAGIFRSGKPAICVDCAPPQGLLEAATQRSVQLVRLDQDDFAYSSTATSWHWRGVQQSYHDLPLPGLAGAHQLANAAGALTLVESLRGLLPVPEAAIRTALPSLKLSGRLEHRGRVLLDVAHNAEAAQVLANYLATQFPGQRLHWIAGLLNDKPVEQIATVLAPHLAHAWTCSLPPPRGLTDTVLQQRLHAIGISATACGSAEQAYAAAVLAAPSNSPILVCGSFLTVAAIQAVL